MHFILVVFRNLLGCIIALFDLITRGPKLKREAQAQQAIEKELENLSLYQFFACPFCIKTRRAMHKLNLPITLRDLSTLGGMSAQSNASRASVYRNELLQGGGKIQTPCLRIQTSAGVEWLYDSSEITRYLQQRFQ